DEPDVVGGALAHGLDQLAPAQRLVGDDQDGLGVRVRRAQAHGWDSWLGGVVIAPAATALPASAGGLKMPCTAPGTPYSYGPPTTVGTASKLKIGGGEETCHSSVSPRHGLAAARGPPRQLATML